VNTYQVIIIPIGLANNLLEPTTLPFGCFWKSPQTAMKKSGGKSSTLNVAGSSS
jgi:hypothetical protein